MQYFLYCNNYVLSIKGIISTSADQGLHTKGWELTAKQSETSNYSLENILSHHPSRSPERLKSLEYLTSHKIHKIFFFSSKSVSSNKCDM